MKPSGVPDGLGVIGQPQLGHAGVGPMVRNEPGVAPGYALEVQLTVTAVGGFAAVMLVIGGKNQAP